MIYQQNDFLFTDLVLSYENILKEEWLNSDWSDFAIFDDMCREMGFEVVYSQTPNWKIGATHAMGDTFYEERIKRYPKAWELVNHFGVENCKTAGYSVLLPNGKINPHEDFDTKGDMVRVQIPILIPEGDVALTVEDTVLHWKSGELILFDHSKMHGAWNNTDQPRVVFLFDLPKKLCLKSHQE